MKKSGIALLLGLTLAMSGCHLPMSSQPVINRGSGLAVPGFADGYYRYGKETLQIEAIGDGEYKYSDGTLSGTLIASPVNKNVWMLQVALTSENKTFFYYMLLRPEAGTGAYLISEISECSKYMQTVFEGITGYVSDCKFARPGLRSLTEALLQVLPAESLPPGVDEANVRTDVHVFRVARIPDRAGQLIHRKIEMERNFIGDRPTDRAQGGEAP